MNTAKTRTRTRTQERKRAGKPHCPACGLLRAEAAVLSGGGGVGREARFCQSCGAALHGEGAAQAGERAGQSAKAGRGKGMIGGMRTSTLVLALSLMAAAAAGLIAVVVASLPQAISSGSSSTSSGGSGGPPPSARVLGASPGASASSVSGGMPPDLSTMTPRQAADRLFNRIMAASEQGRREEAARFLPMAVAAYNGLPALDGDARFHLALIHRVAGDEAAVAEQTAALRRATPGHLLAWMLEHGAATQAGDAARADAAAQAFAAAYESELKTGKTEYADHIRMIERFHKEVAK